jgi:hypothetical protein
MIKFKCSKCGETAELPDDYHGREMTCPGCRHQQKAYRSSVASVAPKPRHGAAPAYPALLRIAEIHKAFGWMALILGVIGAAVFVVNNAQIAMALVSVVAGSLAALLLIGIGEALAAFRDIAQNSFK